MKLSLNLYIVFHEDFDMKNYNILNTNKQYLIFYGVKKRKTCPQKILYENELPIYSNFYQLHKYNESSALFHLYINKIYLEQQWIGLFQYDMRFNKGMFKDIEIGVNNPKTIFYINFFKNERLFFKEGLRGIIKTFPGFTAALPYFNSYFKTTYSIKDLNTMPLVNAFIIPSSLFEQMMKWMLPYFSNIYIRENLTSYSLDHKKVYINPGHLIEAYTGLFLGLHIKMGYKAIKLKCEHDHNIKRKLNKPI